MLWLIYLNFCRYNSHLLLAKPSPNQPNMKKVIICCAAFAMTLSFISCKKDKHQNTDDTDNKSAAMVLLWNDAGTQAVRRAPSVPPMTESRVYAIVNLAMYDALNNITPKYEAYALKDAPVTDADADAAVAQAAHDVIVAVLPPQQAYADSLLGVVLTGIVTGIAKNHGIALGKAAAKAILDNRANDGAATAQYAYVQGTLPGQYRSTPPFDAPPNTGFVMFPGWGKLKPFGLNTAAQFRAAPPYDVSSTEYATDYNEIKKFGCATCPDRTADQTQVGLFWLENVPYSTNRIARILIEQNKLGAWKAARLLALLQMAEADANIACFEGKFFYNFWRPITAVRLGENDGNAATTGDPTWNILAPPTPPVPDYPSNHATDGGAGIEIIKDFFGKEDVQLSLISTTLPGVTRSFINLSQVAREISLSRIYVGYHFRNAVLTGEDNGRKIGKYIFDNCLKEKK
jgi:hypothetical protein